METAAPSPSASSTSTGAVPGTPSYALPPTPSPAPTPAASAPTPASASAAAPASAPVPSVTEPPSPAVAPADASALTAGILAAIAAAGGATPPRPSPLPDLEEAVSAITELNRPCTAVVDYLVRTLGFSPDVFGSIPWFGYTPTADRRSTALAPPRHTLAQLQLGFLRRELRRQKGSKDNESVMLTENAIFTYLRDTSAGGRAYASGRGKFHVALVETRYELVTTCHSLTRVCDKMLQMILHAARRVHVIGGVIERVEGVARGGSSDDAIHEVLRVIERVLLPSTDTDDQALLSVRWHPTDPGEYIARTAHQLAQKLFNVSTFGSATGRDALVLSHFRTQVNIARELPNLQQDPVTKLSIADAVYERFCDGDARERYSTVALLLGALEVPRSLGDRPLEFKESERARERRAEAH